MAEIGNHPGSPDMDYSDALSVGGGTYGLRVTMTEDGTPVSIWWYGTTSATIDVYAAIYDISSAPAVLICDQVSVYSPGSLTEQWHEIPLDTGSLVNGTEYAICVDAETSTGDLAIANGGAVGQAAFKDWYNNLFTSSTWSDGTANPGSSSGGGDDLTMYLEYTPDVGAIDLVIADGAHSHTADNIALTQQNTLVIQDAAHAHTADNVDLVTAITLVVSDGAHGHTAENIDLTQQNVLAIADALHSHTADNLTLDTSALLAIQDAVHSHTADQIALTQANVLAIQDALHAMTADNVDLTQQNVLIIDDALHALISDNVTLTIPTGAVTPRSRSYIIETDDRTFVVMAENRAMIIH